MVKKFCISAGCECSVVCARVLGQMELKDIAEIIESQEFPLVSSGDYCNKLVHEVVVRVLHEYMHSMVVLFCNRCYFGTALFMVCC